MTKQIDRAINSFESKFGTREEWLSISFPTPYIKRGMIDFYDELTDLFRSELSRIQRETREEEQKKLLRSYEAHIEIITQYIRGLPIHDILKENAVIFVNKFTPKVDVLLATKEEEKP